MAALEVEWRPAVGAVVDDEVEAYGLIFERPVPMEDLRLLKTMITTMLLVSVLQ